MQEIIDKIAAQVGIEPELAHKATSMLVNFIVTEVPADYVETIKQYVPGLDELAATGAAHSQAAAAADGGGLMGALGGLMGGGGLAGALGSLMGGSEGGGFAGAMALLGQLNKDGLDLGQVQQMAGSLIGQLREVAGDETVDKLVAQIPGAGQFLA